jgi:hypothetical protein
MMKNRRVRLRMKGKGKGKMYAGEDKHNQAFGFVCPAVA